MAIGARIPTQRWLALVRASLADAVAGDPSARAPDADGATAPNTPDASGGPVPLDDLIAKAVSEVDRLAAGARASRLQLDRMRTRAAASLNSALHPGRVPVITPPVPAYQPLDLRR